MIQHSAAGYRPPAPDPRVSRGIINADRAAPSRVPGRQHRVKAQRSDLSTSIPVLPSSGRAIAHTSRIPKSP
ncbi:hypothetical protein FJV76_13105 [Mesorhizobium sp. WSM4303]|nr:hypothetical protein FJV77_07215 [Mesorhizobium sp. WSM4306]TRD04389.1 hypothetical protein FJV76_13105 [Mesorhizobium sp. WSM4303]